MDKINYLPEGFENDLPKDLCKYFGECGLAYEPKRCDANYNKCMVYQRSKILETRKSKPLEKL